MMRKAIDPAKIDETFFKTCYLGRYGLPNQPKNHFYTALTRIFIIFPVDSQQFTSYLLPYSVVVFSQIYRRFFGNPSGNLRDTFGSSRRTPEETSNTSRRLQEEIKKCLVLKKLYSFRRFYGLGFTEGFNITVLALHLNFCYGYSFTCFRFFFQVLTSGCSEL